jgi:hypothetical protein
MIKSILIFLSAFIFFASCNKKDSGSTTTVVEYQVSATNSSKIDIAYNNVLGNKLTVSALNSWALDITDPTKPYTAYVQASSSSPFSSVTTECTVTILVNGAVVKTTKVASNTVAVAEAEFVVQ